VVRAYISVALPDDSIIFCASGRILWSYLTAFTSLAGLFTDSINSVVRWWWRRVLVVDCLSVNTPGWPWRFRVDSLVKLCPSVDFSRLITPNHFPCTQSSRLILSNFCSCLIFERIFTLRLVPSVNCLQEDLSASLSRS
jgi:hypothetical protein